MLVKTFLNRVQKFKGFVYQAIKWSDHASEPALEIQVVARSNTRGVCRVCCNPAPGYNTQPARRYNFIPFWGFVCFSSIALGESIARRTVSMLNKFRGWSVSIS